MAITPASNPLPWVELACTTTGEQQTHIATTMPPAVRDPAAKKHHAVIQERSFLLLDRVHLLNEVCELVAIPSGDLSMLFEGP